MVAFSKPTSLLATTMVKGEPSTKCAREGDDAMPVVKEDDAVPMMNQDEAPVDPFRDRDDLTVSIMSKGFLEDQACAIEHQSRHPQSTLGGKGEQLRLHFSPTR